ncbi:MAG: class I SAM-dependent methyltransferase [Actinomycetota bacterium]
MFPFWEAVIQPLLVAAEPRRVLEIGALRGDTTIALLDQLGPSSELHVVDPDPQFDPSEHERRFAGRYVFHRATSHAVIPTLPTVDVALIDGDHNWYTVVNELRLLAERSTADAAPLPLLVLHDVAWPYGRRDGYYAPERIPAEHRQPCSPGGIHRDRDALDPDGGLNRHMHNAEHAGGPRNGVLTALEDFATEYPDGLRTVVLPVFVGLAVAVTEARLAAAPGLGPVIDELASPDGLARVEAAAREALRARLAGPPEGGRDA